MLIEVPYLVKSCGVAEGDWGCRMSKVPVAELASLLNDWNMEIKKDHADEAERLFAKAKQAVEEIDDADILMYYSLLEKRHHILMYNLRGQKGNVSTKSIEGHYGKKMMICLIALLIILIFMRVCMNSIRGIMRLHYRCIKVRKSS